MDFVLFSKQGNSYLKKFVVPLFQVLVPDWLLIQAQHLILQPLILLLSLLQLFLQGRRRGSDKQTTSHSCCRIRLCLVQMVLSMRNLIRGLS